MFVQRPKTQQNMAPVLPSLQFIDWPDANCNRKLRSSEVDKRLIISLLLKHAAHRRYINVPDL